MRITNSEYERGWFDCFDAIEIIVSEQHTTKDIFRHMDKLEEEFMVECGSVLT